MWYCVSLKNTIITKDKIKKKIKKSIPPTSFIWRIVSVLGQLNIFKKVVRWEKALSQCSNFVENKRKTYADISHDSLRDGKFIKKKAF